MPTRIAYFVNQYPAVSHTFIRREIHGLEARRFEVLRVALYGWDSDLVDDLDIAERALTRYVLRGGLVALTAAAMLMLLKRPGRFISALKLAYAMSRKGGKPLAYHLAYLAEACRMLPWLEAHGAEHVHAHFGTNSTEVVMLANALGGPAYSFTVHGPDEFDQPEPLGIGEKVERSAFTVAITSYARAQLYRWVDYRAWHKVKVVHCGLEDEFYETEAVPVPDTHRLVCIGRLSEQKGQLLLVRAVKALVDCGYDPQVVLVGAGPMRDQIESLVARLGLEGHMNLTGAVAMKDLKRLIQEARALVLPSFAEGLPMVIMEAMGLRRPVLATYVAGIPELVIPGENGWLVPAGSVDSLIDGIKQVLNTPAERLQAMGEAAFQRVRERHSLITQAESLAALIEESLHSRSSTANGERRAAPEPPLGQS
ncbi:MAG: glycosyltransferase family 4 protein [Pseudomonadales bacterium]